MFLHRRCLHTAQVDTCAALRLEGDTDDYVITEGAEIKGCMNTLS